MVDEELQDLHHHIDELLDQQLWGQIASEIAKLAPADVAEIISRYKPDVIADLFKLLPESIQPDVLAELDPAIAGEVTESMPSEQISDIVTEMDPADAADVLGELDKALSSQVIEQMDDDEADDVRKLLTYPDDSAGGIMTTDMIVMDGGQSVLEALDAIANYEDGKHVYQVSIVDENRILRGIVTIWTLLRQHNRNLKLMDIMSTDFIVVRSDTDQEEVAHIMSKYSLSVLPVVDSQGVLVGRITHDDALDVIQEEAEEDIFRMAGSNDEDLGNTSIIKSCGIRLPWLAITLLGGVVTSTLLNLYAKHFSSIVILAAFIPNVMAMGGNTGIQSSVLLVREIAAGPMRRHAMGKLFFHEVRTGALMGLICGIGIYIWALCLMRMSPPTHMVCSPWYLASVIALALFCAMSFAAGFGAIVPIALDRCKIDPAVASGPFISVVNDISALLIYYAISFMLILRILG